MTNELIWVSVSSSLVGWQKKIQKIKILREIRTATKQQEKLAVSKAHLSWKLIGTSQELWTKRQGVNAINWLST